MLKRNKKKSAVAPEPPAFYIPDFFTPQQKADFCTLTPLQRGVICTAMSAPMKQCDAYFDAPTTTVVTRKDAGACMSLLLSTNINFKRLYNSVTTASHASLVARHRKVSEVLEQILEGEGVTPKGRSRAIDVKTSDIISAATQYIGLHSLNNANTFAKAFKLDRTVSVSDQIDHVLEAFAAKDITASIATCLVGMIRAKVDVAGKAEDQERLKDIQQMLREARKG